MGFVLGFIFAIVLLVLSALAGAWTGVYNIAAIEPHAPAVRWVLDTTMRNSVARRAESIEVPAEFTKEQVDSGFVSFDAMCVQCHGAPGVEPSEWATGLRPQPPALSDAAAHWRAEEVFWILKHGIKMTGMPALGPTHDDEDLWNVVAFVKQMPSLTAEDYAQMRAEADGHGHEEGNGHSHES